MRCSCCVRTRRVKHAHARAHDEDQQQTTPIACCVYYICNVCVTNKMTYIRCMQRRQRHDHPPSSTTSESQALQLCVRVCTTRFSSQLPPTRSLAGCSCTYVQYVRLTTVCIVGTREQPPTSPRSPAPPVAPFIHRQCLKINPTDTKPPPPVSIMPC